MSAEPTSAAEEFESRRGTPLERVHHILHAHPSISPALVLVASAVVFGLINSRFVAAANLSLVTQQVAVVGALAVGQTLVILTAGIDLSVGAIMILSTMVMAKSAADHGVPGLVALLLGVAVGILAGALNGALVTKIGLPPFIVTLGTLSIFTALALLYSGGQSVQSDKLPSLINWTGKSFKIGSFTITAGVLVMLAIYAVVGFALSQTAWGKHVKAVGDDAEATRLTGIRVTRVLFSVYVVAGLIYGITAWILIGRAGAASPNLGADANLDSITAVVIGGTSLFGGRGGVIGTLLGALIVGSFRSGLSLAGVDNLYQTLTIGILVIAAVSVDQWIRRIRS
jgi:fructose transport system permease protein